MNDTPLAVKVLHSGGVLTQAQHALMLLSPIIGGPEPVRVCCDAVLQQMCARHILVLLRGTLRGRNKPTHELELVRVSFACTTYPGATSAAWQIETTTKKSKEQTGHTCGMASNATVGRNWQNRNDGTKTHSVDG